jgi:hypothetical protein
LYYSYNNNYWIYYLLYIRTYMLCSYYTKRALWVIKYCYNYYYRKWLTHFSVYVIFNTSALCEKKYFKYLDCFWRIKVKNLYRKKYILESRRLSHWDWVKCLIQVIFCYYSTRSFWVACCRGHFRPFLIQNWKDLVLK